MAKHQQDRQGNVSFERDNLNRPQDNISPASNNTTITNEDNPIPFPTEGEVKFIKNIYSSQLFRAKVDANISEFLDTGPDIDLNGFFDLYDKLFFDIPKEGRQSHTRLINDSTNYLNNYVNPLQSTLDSLNGRVADLEAALVQANIDLAEALANLTGNDAAEIAAQAEYEGEYGDLNDPRLNIYNIRTNLQYLLDEGRLENDTQNKHDNGPRKDLDQAYENGGDGGIRAGVNTRLWSEWLEDIDKRSSNKDQRDLELTLNLMQQQVKNGYGALLSETTLQNTVEAQGIVVNNYSGDDLLSGGSGDFEVDGGG